MSPDTARRRWVAVTAQRERLLRIARARTLNEQDAEDCVQEAMLRCVEFAGLDEVRLDAFLTTVTIRLCADTHRVRKQRDRAAPRLAGPALAPGPEEDVCDRAEADWVAHRFRALPPRQQEVVTARAEGLSYADAARRFGMSTDAVESMLSRARRTLRAVHAATYGALIPLARRIRLVADATGAVAGAAAVTLVAGLAPRIAAPSAADSGAAHRRPAVAVRVAGPALVAVTAAGTTGVPYGSPVVPSRATEPPRPAHPPAPGAGHPGHPEPTPLVSAGPVSGDAYGSPDPSFDPVGYVVDCATYGIDHSGDPGHVECRTSPPPAPSDLTRVTRTE
jgi:RNA polymerase sigma factor (sigma-70 family)